MTHEIIRTPIMEEFIIHSYINMYIIHEYIHALFHVYYYMKHFEISLTL